MCLRALRLIRRLQLWVWLVPSCRHRRRDVLRVGGLGLAVGWLPIVEPVARMQLCDHDNTWHPAEAAAVAADLAAATSGLRAHLHVRRRW